MMAAPLRRNSFIGCAKGSRLIPGGKFKEMAVNKKPPF
jgi:hypothetical protein